MTMNSPPPSTQVRWCPECGRDGRWKHLSPLAGAHRDETNRKCNGKPVELTYTLTAGPVLEGKSTGGENRGR